MTLIARITALINVVASDIKNLSKNKQDKIKHGTATPTGGNDGDIYLQHQ